MNNLIVQRKKRPYQKQAIFAVACTILIFSVFIGQALFSDVVTFAKSDDQDKLCFASFMKIRECIINRESIVGVDSGSFNGATEFFLRANLPAAYFPFVLFAVLAVYYDAYLMYLLFYAVHMAAALYYLQKVCVRHFQLSQGLAMAAAALYAYRVSASSRLPEAVRTRSVFSYVSPCIWGSSSYCRSKGIIP